MINAQGFQLLLIIFVFCGLNNKNSGTWAFIRDHCTGHNWESIHPIDLNGILFS